MCQEQTEIIINYDLGLNINRLREGFGKKNLAIFMEFSTGGVPPIRQNNYFFEKNIVVGKNLENCLKWSET